MLGCAYVFVVGRVVSRTRMVVNPDGSTFHVIRVQYRGQDNDHKDLLKVTAWGHLGRKLARLYRPGRAITFLGRIRTSAFKERAGIVNQTEIQIIELVNAPDDVDFNRPKPENKYDFSGKSDRAVASILGAMLKNETGDNPISLDDLNDEDNGEVEELLGDQVSYTDEWRTKKWNERKEKINNLPRADV